MRRFTSILMLLAGITGLVAGAQAAWWPWDDTLVAIDGVKHSKDDFKRWWRYWKEEGDELPETLDPYVDWLLMAREAERMELAAEPAFQRGVYVFLKSRALLLLKQEAVNSQIVITDEEVRARYEQQYTPRWLVRHMVFQDPEAAAAARAELNSGAVTAEELIGRPAEDGGPISHRDNWVAPAAIDPGWAAIFRELEVGGTVDPEAHNGGPNVFLLQAREDGNDEEFAKLREGLRRELWREREDDLTARLLDELREKFQVEVDEERLAALDLNAADATLTDAVVISFSRQKVTERDFMGVIERLMAYRPDAAHAAIDKQKARELKQMAVENIIAQRLTDWEALDRHYEQREPFKWEYEFAVRHRLTTALQEKLFSSKIEVSEAEVQEEYAANLERYSKPETVRVVTLDDTRGPLNKVWAEVAVGGSFAAAHRKYLERSMDVQMVALQDLDPEVKAVVEKLVAGETSKPFPVQGRLVMVHLVDRTPATPLPLAEAAETIRARLKREKVRLEREAYLRLLRERSSIEIRERAWSSVREELGGA